MRKSIVAVLTSAVLLALSHGLAGAQQGGWVTKSFDSQVVVNHDAHISVTETVKVDFQVPLHGIFRDIPLTYRDYRMKKVRLRLKLRGITNEEGTPYDWEITRQRPTLTIKIGDPNQTLTGGHTYVIRYDVAWAVGYFKDYDEIYWNASGLEWAVPMEKVTATVTLPANVMQDQIQAAVYAGPLGAPQGGGKWWYEAPDKVHFAADGQLNPGEGLTVSVGWPKGLVVTPGLLTRGLWGFLAALPFLLAVLSWGLAIWMVWTKGRDPAGRGTIAAQYEPPEGLTPPEVGTLVDERMQVKDLSAMIVDLAVRGYLQIIEEEKKLLSRHKNYALKLLKSDYAKDEGLKNFEKKILSALFVGSGSGRVVRLDTLPGGFAGKANESRDQVYNALVKNGYFANHPGKVRTRYVVLGILVFFIGSFVGIASGQPLWILGFALAALPWVAFSWLMPRRTSKGVLTREQIVGFREYLATAEKDRMRFYEQEFIFDKYLPFAMSLGVAHLWAKAFEGILKTDRAWYVGSSPASSFASLSAGDFASGLSSSFGSALGAATGGGSGSGGGGFSGGGGGGGGGGAW